MTALRAFGRGILATAFALALAACTDREHAIAYGEDTCDFCRMMISDPRFGAELVTMHGRVRVFDSVECLASFAASLPASEPPRRILVSDFAHPGTFLPVADARFERVEGSSPMGRGLRAFARGASAGDRTSLTWDDVVTLMQRQGFDRGQ